jgi:Immunity protein 35
VRERIDVHTARGLARHQIATLAVDSGLDLVVQHERTLDTDIGWVFFYESRRYLETRDPHEQLIGNAPILVCHSGAVHLLGTEHPVEHYLDEFRRSGDPYGATATELGG